MMRRLLAAAMISAVLSGTVWAADDTQYVTVKDRLICRTQQSLREMLRAIDTKDRALGRTVQGCVYTVDGVPAKLIQDNISAIKVLIGFPGEQQTEFWTLPETIRPTSGR